MGPIQNMEIMFPNLKKHNLTCTWGLVVPFTMNAPSEKPFLKIKKFVQSLKKEISIALLSGSDMKQKFINLGKF
jgi:hypothetical protein